MRQIPQLLSPRHYAPALVLLILIGSIVAARELGPGWWLVAAIAAALIALGVYDLLQTSHAIRRNYPIVGNIRWLVEAIRPELRQYLFESETEATPFSRAQRSLVYQRAKGVEDARPFGTEQDVYGTGYEWVNHSMQPRTIADTDDALAFAEVAVDLPLVDDPALGDFT